MSDLAEFLLARIAEDEAVAQAAEGWFQSTDWTSRAAAEHGDRFDPARVLAECKAKRRIVEWHADTEECCEERLGPMVFDDEPTISVGTDAWGGLVTRRSIGHQVRLGCVTLMMLALPYADHEQFREEWRPDDDI